jgi:D-alanine-D-alanine ligase
MKVAIVYNDPVEGKPDSLDVLDQVTMVKDALENLGYEFQSIPVGSGAEPFSHLLAQLKKFGPSTVFNLFEGLNDDQRYCPMIASLFEMVRIPYTGVPFQALLTTTDKILAKSILTAYGLPTPLWQPFTGETSYLKIPPPWILKPAWEDGSVGIDDSSILEDRKQLKKKLREMQERHETQPILIEQYIEGREINVPLFEQADTGVKILPISEILFEDWPEDKPKIVNYSAKWIEDSFEYENTQRTFAPENAPLNLIKDLALRCWKIFHLKGYVRVDMRLDEWGTPYIIEINPNPCIGGESGFISSVREGGYTNEDFVREMIAVACVGPS